MKEILINIHFDIIQFAYATAIQIKHNRLFCLHFTADVNFHLMNESKNQNTVGSVKYNVVIKHNISIKYIMSVYLS